MRLITPRLVSLVRERFALDWHGIHGAAHWARVRANGLLLAERCGADRAVVEVFAFVHDACREHDGGDHWHGARSSDWVRQLGPRELNLASEQIELLAAACEGHSHGGLEAEVTVQVCWDADRLDLARVGIRPRPERLCTPAARDAAVIEWAVARSLRWRPQRPAHASPPSR